MNDFVRRAEQDDSAAEESSVKPKCKKATSFPPSRNRGTVWRWRRPLLEAVGVILSFLLGLFWQRQFVDRMHTEGRRLQEAAAAATRKSQLVRAQIGSVEMDRKLAELRAERDSLKKEIEAKQRK